jgi:hypothetical protein
MVLGDSIRLFSPGREEFFDFVVRGKKKRSNKTERNRNRDILFLFCGEVMWDVV